MAIEVCESRVLLVGDAVEFFPGDANRDGVFNSSDLTGVFQAGEFEDGVSDNSRWEDGDWNGDGDFDSSDLVLAFQQGKYTTEDAKYPDVLNVELTKTGEGLFRVAVTLSSPYDTAERYADAWRILAPDCQVLGVGVLTHDHQFEQPFTRSLSGVVIPSEVMEVTVQGRDQIGGWGGTTITVSVPG